MRGLLRADLAAGAAAGVQDDLDQLKRRAQGKPAYAFLELEQQGQYMRGMIAHVMSVINEWCTLYQAFTAPEVYGYMWSIHPAARTDEVYVELIRKLGNDLIAVPWARTNRPIDKAIRPVVRYRDAAPDYRQYHGWMAVELREEMHAALDPAWFADTHLFDRNAVEGLRSAVTSLGLDAKQTAYSPYHVAAWLWSFRRFAESVLLARPKLPQDDGAGAADCVAAMSLPKSDERSVLRQRLADVRPLLKMVRHSRKWWLRRDSLKRYPPE
jgi:asparagine synthase (glutamine-hydrolysing)